MANEDTWQRCAVEETHRNKVAAVPRALATELEKGSGKGKGKGKRRASETCMCCGKEGHKNADSKFRTAACSNFGKIDWSLESGVSKHQHTRDLMSTTMKTVHKSLSKQSGA